MNKLTMAAGLAISASAFAQQAADNCTDAPEVASGSYAFDLNSASNDGSSTCGLTTTAADVWLKHTPTLSGNLIVATCGGTTMDTVLSAFDGCGGNQLVCVDDFCGLQSQISVPVTAGTPVWIRIAGFNGNTGSGTVTITAPEPPPANDNCANAQPITLDTPVNFNTINATNDGSASCRDSTAGDVWYSFHAASAGGYRFSTCGSQLDTVLTVFDGCGGSELGCNDDTCGFQSRVDAELAANQTVIIRVGGYLAATGTGTLTVSAAPVGWHEDGDAGNLPDTAQSPAGSGPLGAIFGTLDSGDADMYRIRICDMATFQASVVGDVTFDTQMFLFNTDGMGVAFDDDSQGFLQSTITNQFVTAEGDYLLAISSYDYDPASNDGDIWIDTPFNVERQPDGPGAGSPITSWGGTAFNTGGAYVITLTGTCFPGPSNSCVADVDDGTGTGHPDGGVTIDDLLYYLVIYTDGNIAADVDNGTFTGTHDGGVTIDDLLYFLARYADGC